MSIKSLCIETKIAIKLVVGWIINFFLDHKTYVDLMSCLGDDLFVCVRVYACAYVRVCVILSASIDYLATSSPSRVRARVLYCLQVLTTWRLLLLMFTYRLQTSLGVVSFSVWPWNLWSWCGPTWHANRIEHRAHVTQLSHRAIAHLENKEVSSLLEMGTHSSKKPKKMGGTIYLLHLIFTQLPPSFVFHDC